METTPITFDQLPQAVANLTAKMDLILQMMQRPKVESTINKRPIKIDEACKILGLAKITIYRLSAAGKIPSYKNSKELNFYEDELLDYVASGMRKSSAQINAEVDNYVSKKFSTHNHNT